MKPANLAIRTIQLSTLSLLLSFPAFAHHSTAAFDNEKVIKIEGTITQFRWTNPHASIKLEGDASEGPDGLWTVEMTAPNSLMQSGWKRTSLKQGDRVTIWVHPLRNGARGGSYAGVRLPNGTTLGEAS